MSPIDDTGAPIVRVSALTKQVTTGDAQLTILGDVSFDITAGGAVAIIGASGSGKSTLLGLLAGLDTPTAGRVMLDGHDLFTLDEDERAKLRARLVGFVFQSFQLLGGLTALENVMLPLELAGRGDAQDAARAMLTRVGLEARLHHYPKHLSGGEQQRVALARAFVVRPKLLLADEPTGSLDAASGTDIIDLMFGLNHDLGTTLVMVTHDEQLAVRCQRVIRLAAGRIQSQRP
jgi:putative ABC transport system ATP-binding protein